MQHHCLSLTQPELSDCDGFCYLKKKVDKHKDHDMDSHGTTVYVPKVPFVYLPEVRSGGPAFNHLPEIDIRFFYKESIPDDIFPDVISPPPKA